MVPNPKWLGIANIIFPGSASGRAVFRSESITKWHRDTPLIAVIKTPSLEFIMTNGFLVKWGNKTSNASVVIRGSNKPMFELPNIDIDSEKKIATFDGIELIAEGDIVTLEELTGKVLVNRTEPFLDPNKDLLKGDYQPSGKFSNLEP